VIEEVIRLQRAMANAVLTGEEAGLLDYLADPPPGCDLLHRVGAYTGGYHARVEESLLESFPALAAVLGGAAFHSLVHRYLPCINRDEPNLNYIGRDLPGFLADDELGVALPFVPDLARLEWAVLECFHGAWLAAADLSLLEDLGQDQLASLRLDFQPAAALVVSDWPIKEIRDARDYDRDSVDIDLVDRPDSVLVYRAGFDVVTEGLGEAEATALESMRAGATLGQTVQQLADSGAGGDDIGAMFARWTGLSLVTVVRA